MTDLIKDRPIVIVEDSDEDFEVLIWALRQADVTNPIHRCANAEAVLGMTAKQGSGPASIMGLYPALISLDLNVPGTDWQETLSAFRSNPWWRPVPVVVISTSGQRATIAACYALGASGYLQKPLNLDELAAAIKQLATYWLKTVRLPAFPPDIRKGGGSP